MTQYSPDQVAQFAYNAGFRGQDLANATAVALAESSGDPNAKSTDGYNSVGLWQFIPATWAKYGAANASPNDPQANANAAFKLWQANGNSFAGQWSTWPSAASAAANGQIGGATHCAQPPPPPPPLRRHIRSTFKLALFLVCFSHFLFDAFHPKCDHH